MSLGVLGMTGSVWSNLAPFEYEQCLIFAGRAALLLIFFFFFWIFLKRKLARRESTRETKRFMYRKLRLVTWLVCELCTCFPHCWMRAVQAKNLWSSRSFGNGQMHLSASLGQGALAIRPWIKGSPPLSYFRREAFHLHVQCLTQVTRHVTHRT